VANNGRAIIKLPFQRRLISFKFNAFIMGLRGELEKQGPWGIVSMILAFLGAAGFFNVNSSTITGYAPNGLSINWLAFGPVLLLLINSIITFVTRRENAKIKRNLNDVKKELDATEKSHEELKQLLKKERSETERLQKKLDGLNKICRNDELERLIKPLYTSLDSNQENPINGAHLAFGEIKQYGNLAQPELRNLLSQYCNIREEHVEQEDQAPS
jgi:hypothetical protein